MKHIIKGPAPQELQSWFDGQPIENGQRINCGYDHMPGDVKEAVQQHLLAEQGWLCCYTGMRVDEKSCHIEHFKPRRFCEGNEDVDYANLLAAYPGANIHRCPYGAHAKDDWYDPKLLVSPLKKQCETQFRFDQFGRISPADGSGPAAPETIARMHLDDGSLTDLREQAIDEALFPTHRLSEAKLRIIAQNGFSSQNAKGQFPRFCFVIEQVAQQLLHKAERDRKRRQAIHNRAHR